MSDKERRIRARAYEIYEQEGRHDGRAEEHWQQAKREIEHALASAQAQAAEAPAQPPTTADEPTRPSPKQTQTGADALGAQGASQKRAASQKKASAASKPVEGSQTSARTRSRRAPLGHALQYVL
jgi:hypothetical protein